MLGQPRTLLEKLLISVRGLVPGIHEHERKGYVRLEYGGKTLAYIDGMEKLKIKLANGEKRVLEGENLAEIRACSLWILGLEQPS